MVVKYKAMIASAIFLVSGTEARSAQEFMVPLWRLEIFYYN